MNVLSISKFIEERLKPFSNQSNIRAIPFIGDGLKEVQRKMLWGILSRGENKEADTVERIAAYACSVTDYHHGAVSMEDAIVKVACSYPGTNNMPLLVAGGQFGSRKSFEASATRYIETKLSENFRALFDKLDDPLMEQIVSSGMKVEPYFFIPKLPIILINGAQGIGTGHATEILSYNPDDIKKAIDVILSGGELEDGALIPYFRGFTGTVERNKETKQVTCRGKWELKKQGRNTFLHITELPIGIQGDKYKTMLDEMESKKIIKDYEDLTDKNGFDYLIKLDEATIKLSEDKLIKLFKLESKTTENLTVWDSAGKLRRFTSTEELLKNWVEWRLDLYTKRFKKQIELITGEIEVAKERRAWIELYLNNVEFFKTASDAEVKTKMKDAGIVNIQQMLSTPMRALTRTEIEKLDSEINALESEKIEIQTFTPIDIMRKEIKKIK